MSKKSAKSVEELLKEVLVPEEEQPYKVPENWIWVKSEAIAKWGSGGTPSRNNLEYYQGNIPWIKTGELRDQLILETEEYISEDAVKNSSAKLFPKGSVAIAMYGATIGKMGIFGIDATTNQACAVGTPNDLTTTLFMYYFFKAQKEQFINLGKGGAQPNISQTVIKNYPFPLPPLNEQKRIADKVERLLDKINQAKQLIEEAKETFELRRAAILDKAFRGELTREWREENQTELSTKEDIQGVPEGWTLKSFDSIAADEKYALAIGPFGSNLKVTDYQSEGIQLIFVRNIRSSDYQLDSKYVSNEKSDELKAHIVESGDILITKMGDPPGDVDICPAYVKRAVITADCIKLRVNEKVADNKFIMYAIKSPFVQKQIQLQTKGVAQQKISLKTFREMTVLLPPILEQHEIMVHLEKYMESEMETSKRLGMVDKYLVDLQQSILSRAFSGEMGTNISEESVLRTLSEFMKFI